MRLFKISDKKYLRYMNNTTALSVHHLKKTFRTSSNRNEVLKDVNIVLEKGVVAILGSNGAGKTTFIRSCTDLLDYEEGKIEYFGKDLQTMSKEEKNRTFALLSEGSRNIYYKLTPWENIKYFAAVRGVPFNAVSSQSKELLNELGLYDKRNQLVENLSRGMQQKVAIICALSMNTPVVFLDEPTLGLDIESAFGLSSFLSSPEITSNRLIIMTSHDFNFIERTARQIFKLQDGVMKRKEDTASFDNSFILKILHPDINKLQAARYEILERHDLYCTIRLLTTALLLGKEIDRLNQEGHEVTSVEIEGENLKDFYLN